MKFPSLAVKLLAAIGAWRPPKMYFSATKGLEPRKQRFPGERRRAGSNKFPNPFTPPSGSGPREWARRQRQMYGAVRF